MLILYYVSGHGFGHASRSIEVIKAIRRRAPEAHIVVRSSVPRWFLDASLPAGVEVQACETDVGVVQIDSLRLDEDATARVAAKFYRKGSDTCLTPVTAVGDLVPGSDRCPTPSLIIGDIPPLAFAAAHAAGVPSVAIGNFTWDWIYSGYPRFEALAPGVIDTIRRAYAHTALALRLPFSGGFEPMAGVTRDIPLIARRARRDRADVRRTLHLDEGRPVVLASFGGHGLRLSYDQIASDGSFTLLVTDHEAAGAAGAHGRLRRLTQAELAAHDLAYEDLVAAADVVVSKPGYGIISECIANGAALLYTTRGRFREQDILVSEMPRFLRCREISQDDLAGGHWQPAIEALLQQPPPDEPMAIDGAQVAADAILARC